MTNNEIIAGLKQLGFSSGWVVTGEKITLWEQSVPQPTDAQLLAASNLYTQTMATNETAKQAARQAVLDRLGITAEEAALLLGGM